MTILFFLSQEVLAGWVFFLMFYVEQAWESDNSIHLLFFNGNDVQWFLSCMLHRLKKNFSVVFIFYVRKILMITF